MPGLGMPPGIPVPPGIPPGMLPGMGAAAQANMLASMKGAKGAGLVPGAAAAAAGGKGTPARKESKEKAAFKAPTDEEVHARLMNLSMGTEPAPADAVADATEA